MTNGELIYYFEELVYFRNLTQEKNAKLPSKLSYAILKNIKKLQSIIDLRDEILKQVYDVFSKEKNIDKERVQTDKKYSKQIGDNFSEYVLTSELYLEFLKEKLDFEFFTFKGIVNKSQLLKDQEVYIDEDFDFNLIPFSLLDKIIFID